MTCTTNRLEGAREHLGWKVSWSHLVVLLVSSKILEFSRQFYIFSLFVMFIGFKFVCFIRNTWWCWQTFIFDFIFLILFGYLYFIGRSASFESLGKYFSLHANSTQPNHRWKKTKKCVILAKWGSSKLVPHISYLFTTVYLQTAFIFIQDSSSK